MTKKARVIITGEEENWFTPKDTTTRYKYRRIPADVDAKLRDRLNYAEMTIGKKKEKTYFNIHQYKLKVLQYGVLGWENMENAKTIGKLLLFVNGKWV